MREILMNEEMDIYVPEGDGPAIGVQAAMFGPYRKPVLQRLVEFLTGGWA